jgi:hypothetical protein
MQTFQQLRYYLYEQEFFDLSVLEAWKAIETSINKALFYQGLYSEKITGFKLIDYAKSKKLFKNSQLKEILDIWRFRNKVSHTEEQVSAQKTEEILAIADHLIASLEAIRNQCYYCNKLKKTTEMHCDNITGAYICKNCLKDHPNWKEELMDMGMDP